MSVRVDGAASGRQSFQPPAGLERRGPARPGRTHRARDEPRSRSAAATRPSTTGSTSDGAASPTARRSGRSAPRGGPPVLRGEPRGHRARAPGAPLLLRLPGARPAGARARRPARARHRLRRRPPAGRAAAVARRRHRPLGAGGGRGPRAITAPASLPRGRRRPIPTLLAPRGRPVRRDPARQRGHPPHRRAARARGPARRSATRARASSSTATAALWQPVLRAGRAAGPQVPPAARGLAAAGGDRATCSSLADFEVVRDDAQIVLPAYVPLVVRPR